MIETPPERIPILQEGPHEDIITPLLGSESSSAVLSTASRKWLILTAIAVYILTVDLGFYLTAAPQMEIFQDIICSRHYSSILGESRATTTTTTTGSGSTDGGKDPCKSEAVQSELALIYGWLDTFTVLPGVLLSVPFGVLSDRWGRKPILNLGLVGFLFGDVWVRVVCYWRNVFPLRLVWLCGLWRVMGGGDSVTSSMALVMVADVCSERERANVLFCINAVIIVAEVLAIPMSAYLMSFSPWIPYTLGFLVEIIGSSLVLFLPETLGIAKQETKMAFCSWDMQSREEDEVHPVSRETTTEIVLSRIRIFRDSTHMAWENMNIMLILVAFFVANISKQSTGIFLQYTSKKFHWSIARSSLLVVVRGIVTIINFLVLMPAISFLVTKHLHWEPKWKDFRLSQGSGLLAILGFTTMALSTGPIVLIFGLVALALGSAFAITSRSLATSLVSADHVGTLYSTAAVVQSLGNVIAGPLFAYSFSLGLRLGKSWLGLPFLQAALFFVIVFIAISCIRLGPLERGINATSTIITTSSITVEDEDSHEESRRTE